MSKGIFIPDITIEQFRNASLEAVEELLISGEMRDMENMINLDEALEYCKRCADIAEKLMMDSLNAIKGEMNMNTIAMNYQASNYFQQENIYWRYYAPNMLKALADGTWKEHFEESENRQKVRNDMSGDVMTFPDTWEEYEEDYGFTDTEQIYTNGSRLIQSFRVKQWLEHIEVSEDCISRKALLEQIEGRYGDGWHFVDIIKDAPSVVPQVPSEDCIDRYSALAELDPSSYEYEVIKELPSVVSSAEPKRENEDLISRQDALDAIAKFVPYVIDDMSTESYTNGLKDAYNLIYQLPIWESDTE